LDNLVKELRDLLIKVIFHSVLLGWFSLYLNNEYVKGMK